MPRLRLAAVLLLLAARAVAFDEPAVADRNLAAIITQLETGNWNARIHAVHELDYMQSEGLPGLAHATGDGDWQVRMTAVHAIGSRGVEGAPILKELLRHEPCPVVRLMTLHSLGSLGPEGEEVKAMVSIFEASGKEVNNCHDQSGPGRAPWARGKEAARTAPGASERARRRAAPAPVRRAEPEPEPPENEVVTRDPVPPPAPKTVRPPEILPAPTKFQRHVELDALLDASTAPIARRGVTLEMTGRSTGAPENLPLAVGLIPREHEVTARGVLMKDAGGKAPHDPLPGLLRALKRGKERERALAADDLGHLGASGAVPALLAALGDRSARVRSSASLALGNIGATQESVVAPLKYQGRTRAVVAFEPRTISNVFTNEDVSSTVIGFESLVTVIVTALDVELHQTLSKIISRSGTLRNPLASVRLAIVTVPAPAGRSPPPD